MLGRFLELSLLAGDTGTAWQRWLELGFVGAETGDVWPHAYGVAVCEGLAIGLHAAGDEPLCVSFVRPEVVALERELADRLIGIERAQLGAEEFNLLELREPGGTLLRVQEARSYSPPPETPAVTALGRFRALSLPCADLAEAQGFWERLDVDVQALDQPWSGITLGATPLACHDLADCRDAVLLFDGSGIDADTLKHLPGFRAAPPLPALIRRRHRLLRAAEGVALLVLDAD